MCSFTTAWRGVIQFGLQGGQICSLLPTEESAWPPHSHDHSSILPECLGFKSYCILLQCFQLCVLQILQCCFLGLGPKHVCVGQEQRRGSGSNAPAPMDHIPMPKKLGPWRKGISAFAPSRVSQPRSVPQGAPGLPPPPMYDAGWADCQDRPGPKGPQGWPPEAP